MEKNGELRAGQSVCDLCSSPAVTVAGGRALCSKHSKEKTAGDQKPIRSAGEQLSFNFDAAGK